METVIDANALFGGNPCKFNPEAGTIICEESGNIIGVVKEKSLYTPFLSTLNTLNKMFDVELVNTDRVEIINALVSILNIMLIRLT